MKKINLINNNKKSTFKLNNSAVQIKNGGKQTEYQTVNVITEWTINLYENRKKRNNQPVVSSFTEYSFEINHNILRLLKKNDQFINTSAKC